MEGSQHIPVRHTERPSKPIIIHTNGVDDDQPTIFLEDLCGASEESLYDPFVWPDSPNPPGSPTSLDGSDRSEYEAKYPDLQIPGQRFYPGCYHLGDKFHGSDMTSFSSSSSSSPSTPNFSDFSLVGVPVFIQPNVQTLWINNISQSSPGLPIGKTSHSCPPSLRVSPDSSPLLAQGSRSCMSSREDLDLEHLIFGPGGALDLPPRSPTPSVSPSPSLSTTPYMGHVALADTELLAHCDPICQADGPSSFINRTVFGSSGYFPSSFGQTNGLVSAPAYSIHHRSLDPQERWGGGQLTDSEQEDYSDQSNPNFNIEPRPPDILSISSLDFHNSYGQPFRGVDDVGAFLMDSPSKITNYTGGCDPQPPILPSSLPGRKSDHLPQSLGLSSNIQQSLSRGRRRRSETLEVRPDLSPSDSLHVTTTRTTPYPSRNRPRTRPKVQSGFRDRVSTKASKKASDARRTADAPHHCPHCFDTFTRQDGLRDHIARHNGDRITSECEFCKEQKTTTSRHVKTCRMNPNRQPPKPSKKKKALATPPGPSASDS